MSIGTFLTNFFSLLFVISLIYLLATGAQVMFGNGQGSLYEIMEEEMAPVVRCIGETCPVWGGLYEIETEKPSLL